MLIHEVCGECRLTKKAVEYYAEQGLVFPSVLENGYRCFSKSDIERLKKIAVLRGLGLAVSDIQKVLDSQEVGALSRVSHERDIQISEMREKQLLLEKLARDNDWESIKEDLETLEKKQFIMQRLLGKFPGYYGKYVSLHFAPYLNEAITTLEQQEAFEAIITYLDGANLTIPDDLKEYIDEVTAGLCGVMPDISKNISEAVNNTEQYMADNKETLEQYMEYMKSDEYKQSIAFRMKEYLTQFNKQSGYNDVFIPAMIRLSSSYKKYYDDLMKANEVFLKKYGDKVNG